LGFGHAADPLIRMGRSRSEQPRRPAPVPVPSARSLWRFVFLCPCGLPLTLSPTALGQRQL